MKDTHSGEEKIKRDTYSKKIKKDTHFAGQEDLEEMEIGESIRTHILN